jgi:hypothetical protein
MTAQPDLEKTELLMNHFQVEHAMRDEKWAARFYETVVDASFASQADQVLQGPDRFPYFVLKFPEPMKPFESFSVRIVLEHCTNSGLGIVINPHKPRPDWVFTYGQLWSFREYGAFSEEGIAHPDKATGEVLLASPNEKLFPAYARKVLRAYLKHIGVAEPKCFVMMDGSSPQPSIVFNVFRELFSTDEEHRDAMARLTWFLPSRLGLISVGGPKEFADAFHTF